MFIPYSKLWNKPHKRAGSLPSPDGKKCMRPAESAVALPYEWYLYLKVKGWLCLVLVVYSNSLTQNLEIHGTGFLLLLVCAVDRGRSVSKPPAWQTDMSPVAQPSEKSSSNLCFCHYCVVPLSYSSLWGWHWDSQFLIFLCDPEKHCVSTCPLLCDCLLHPQ